MCAARALPPARGFSLPTRPLTPARPGPSRPAAFAVTLRVVPYFLPSRLPLRPSPSTSHTPGPHSGVLFPGQGAPWGEPSGAGSRLDREPSLCSARAWEPACGKAPRSVLPKGNVPPSCPPATGLAPLGPELPNVQIPAHPASTSSKCRAPHVTPATGRGIA